MTYHKIYTNYRPKISEVKVNFNQKSRSIKNKKSKLLKFDIYLPE